MILRDNIFKFIILLVIFIFSFLAEVYAKGEYTIVIDAGHGGKDPGAVDNNIKEKDVNLGVALLLGKMIKDQTNNINVVYTRDKDTYLTLQQRADKANKSKGDLFISIHVNSVDKRNKNRHTISGSSVYTLGLDKNDDNITVAQRENSVISLEADYETKYQGFNPDSDESYIIFEMVQKDNLNQSIILANNIQQQLVKVAKRKDRGVRQAGFWVLWATSMPAVLVELDFICNPNSAKYIASTTGQKKMAEGIFNAVKLYFEQLTQQPLVKEGIMEEEPSNAELSTNYSEGVVLENTLTRKDKTSNAPISQSSDANSIQKRRRRSESSKLMSANREIEIAVIDNSINQEFQYEIESNVNLLTENIETGFENPVESLSVPNNNSMPIINETIQLNNSENDVINTENFMIEQESVTIEEHIDFDYTQEIQPAKQSNKQRRSVARLNTYYTIILFESPEHLMDDDPIFNGLSSVKIKEVNNGNYMYICGEYNTKSEVTKIFNKVITKFPDATIIRINKGTNKIIN